MAKLVFEYQEGDIVYLKTDHEQLPHIVIGFDVRGVQVRYWLRQAVEESLHYSFEIRTDRDVILSTSN